MSSLITRIRDFLTKNSTLQTYLPLAYETTQEKVVRVVNDKSNLGIVKYPSAQPLAKGKLEDEKRANLCIDPLNNWLIVWYFFVFQSIIFYYTEMTIILTYGE